MIYVVNYYRRCRRVSLTFSPGSCVMHWLIMISRSGGMGWCHASNVSDSGPRPMTPTTRYMHVLYRSTAVGQRPRDGRAKAPVPGRRRHGRVRRIMTSVRLLTSQTATRTALSVPSASRAVRPSHVLRQLADTAQRPPCSQHTRQPARQPSSVKGTPCAAISAAAAVTPRTSAGVLMTSVSSAICSKQN